MLTRLYFSFLFFCGIWVFSSNRKYLLATLLSLEFIVLVLFVIVYSYLCYYDYELYFVMLFWVFSVCEGSLGLSILVSKFVALVMIFFSLMDSCNVKVFISSFF